MILYSPNGQTITTLEEWLQYAPPKKREEHWKDYRSAKENARAWLRTGEPAMPQELAALMESRPETREFDYSTGYPENVIRLDDFRGEHRNSDITVHGRRGNDHIVLDVEAKADESFGSQTVQQAYDRSRQTPGSNGYARVQALCLAVFGCPLENRLSGLCYQLLYSLAAPVIEARARNAAICTLIIHEFYSPRLSPKKLAANATGLQAFVNAVPGWEHETVVLGQLLPPITLPGNGKVRNDIRVTLGKIRSVLA